MDAAWQRHLRRRVRVIRVDIAMSTLLSAIRDTRDNYVRPRAVCLSPSRVRSANDGPPKSRRTGCNESARKLLPGCFGWFLSDRSLTKDSAGLAGADRRPRDGKIKAARSARLVGAASICLYVRFFGPILLIGICFCTACGGAMTLRTGKSGRYRYYIAAPRPGRL